MTPEQRIASDLGLTESDLAKLAADHRAQRLAPRLAEALRTLEARLTAAGRAFYGSGSRSALQAALDGWVADAQNARAILAELDGRQPIARLGQGDFERTVG